MRRKAYGRMQDISAMNHCNSIHRKSICLTLAAFTSCYSGDIDSVPTEQQQSIRQWILNLDDDSYRKRAAAQSALESLRGEPLKYARDHLVEKQSLEYMTRRRRILNRFSLTIRLARIEQELESLKTKRRSSIHGLEAYSRLIGSTEEAAETFFEISQRHKSYLVTVYAAPHYAQDAVRAEIDLAGTAGKGSDLRTDTLALHWSAVFLTLCDKSVQLDERKAVRQLNRLHGSNYSRAIATGMTDRKHGPVLRILVGKFLDSAGERGEGFANLQRMKLAFQLRKNK